MYKFGEISREQSKVTDMTLTSLMTLKCNAKFEEKLTCGFKYDMRNSVNFHPTTQKSENLFSMCSFYPKYTRFEPQKYLFITVHDTEQ